MFVLTAVAHLSLKKGMIGKASYFKQGNVIKGLIKIIKNKYMILGISLFGLVNLLWLVVVSRVELSYAYPLFSLNFVLVAIFSKILFKEHVSKLRWLSIAIIIIGVILITSS